MKIQRHADVETFRAIAEPLLLADEPENNLMLGTIGRVASRPKDSQAKTLLAVLLEGDKPIGAFLRSDEKTPIITTRLPAHADDVVGKFLRNENQGPFDLVGEAETVRRIAARWDGPSVEHMHLGVYAARSVRPTPPVPGHLRKAEPRDLDLLCDWAHAFEVEAHLRHPGADPTESLKRRIAAGQIYLWDDQDAVSQTYVSTSTPNGIKITGVYTPPSLRGKGYASKLVATLTKSLLDEGRTFVFLFTDMTNPTSNRIYQRIGYEPVGDYAHVILTPRTF